VLVPERHDLAIMKLARDDEANKRRFLLEKLAW